MLGGVRSIKGEKQMIYKMLFSTLNDASFFTLNDANAA